jgi:NAD(P)-dependent dehydrogenase (short-subunit alcohol dehydrogenase family)
MSINKVVIITGASRGIGYAIASRFHRDGAAVVLCARSVEKLREYEAELGSERSLAVGMDIRSQQSVDEGIRLAVERFGSIDVIVNNAGISGVTPVYSEDTGAWLDIIQTNIVGSYYVTRAGIPHMRDGGSVIMMSSVLGKFGVPGYTAYCSAKTALIGFTRSLALELAHRRITVNALCPGWVDTEMAWSGMRDIAASLGVSTEEFRKDAMSKVPLGEMVAPSEVADLVVFLASEAGKNITGQAISICGGSTHA